ncbi:hypothetical protein BDV11DRAFT_184299 [Aspergillus similis]
MAIYHAKHVSLSGVIATGVISDQACKPRDCPELRSQAIRSVGIARTSSCKGSVN